MVEAKVTPKYISYILFDKPSIYMVTWIRWDKSKHFLLNAETNLHKNWDFLLLLSAKRDYLAILNDIIQLQASYFRDCIDCPK